MTAHKVTDQSFDQDVLQSSTPVVVDFWAEWCAPCRAMGPVLDELAGELSGKIKIAKMNVEENPNVPTKFGIRGIPAFLLFKDGKLADQRTGRMTKEQMLSWLTTAA